MQREEGKRGIDREREGVMGIEKEKEGREVGRRMGRD